MQTYFANFGHAWLHSPKMIVFNAYWHAKNKTSQFTSFLQYYILKNPAIWFVASSTFWPITRDPKLCQICWWNISNNISFHYRLFPRKANIKKTFKKFQKPYFGPICWVLSPKGPKMNFPGKKGSVSFAKYLNYLATTSVPKIRKT